MLQDDSRNECLICFNSIMTEANLFQLFYYSDIICCKCRRQLIRSKRNQNLNGLKIESFYLYEEWSSKLLLQYKELWDEALAPVFLYPFQKEIQKKYKGYSLVPIPSTKEKYQQRGFSPVIKMFECCGMEVIDVLSKKRDVEQKNQRKSQRSKIEFQLKELDFSKKKLLLIDDVVTTGSSMRAAYTLLAGKCKKIKLLTVIICDEK